jgi:arginine decarboxylase
LNTVIGLRVPKDFFITQGKGESDITVHAGSYHLALLEAGIEMCNIMTYSSILPKIANRIEKPEALTHGSVMETIMAESTCRKGESTTAAIIFGWLYDRETGGKHGGLVCEYHGEKSEADAKAELRQSLDELFTNGYDDRFELRDVTVVSQSVTPTKRFGTALVAICFVNHLIPIIDNKFGSVPVHEVHDRM